MQIIDSLASVNTAAQLSGRPQEPYYLLYLRNTHTHTHLSSADLSSNTPKLWVTLMVNKFLEDILSLYETKHHNHRLSRRVDRGVKSEILRGSRVAFASSFYPRLKGDQVQKASNWFIISVDLTNSFKAWID